MEKHAFLPNIAAIQAYLLLHILYYSVFYHVAKLHFFTVSAKLQELKGLKENEKQPLKAGAYYLSVRWLNPEHHWNKPVLFRGIAFQIKQDFEC